MRSSRSRAGGYRRRRPHEGCELRPSAVIAATCAALLCALAPASAADTSALERALDDAFTRYAALEEGEVAAYIPALAAADPDRFGLVVMTVDGEVIARGDTDVPFAIMSAAKPFTLALLMQQSGPDIVREKIGVEPTGVPFNSLIGIDRGQRRGLNPMVNAGAIVTVSLIDAATPEQRWSRILDFYRSLAGAELEVMADVYASVGVSNFRNRAIVNLLQNNDWLGADPVETLDVYNRQSCVAVTARQLAAMGATLANGGLNPATGKRVMDAANVDEVLAVMMLAGMYDESGTWAYGAGIPAKSGVGGGIVAVIPGRMAIVGFSPRLSETGNSVRAMRAITDIAREEELGLFQP